VFAIDAHDGVVGALDTGLQALTPTRERFERTIADAGLTRVVVPLARRPSEVAWVRPISLLLIDGLHDYPNVARDFHHFEEHLVPGGYVAFHDYADYFPGVKAFVNELVAGGGYEHVMRTRSLALVRKSAAAQPLVSKAATIVMIPHDDVDCACRRLSRDIVPSLEHYPDWSFELIVVDNSARRMDRLADAVAALPWPSRYVWHDGANLYYGPALNVAANLASHPVLVYVCANHGRMVDPGWIEDLVTPIWDDERVAMTGHPYPSQHPSELGFRDTGQYFHIQGGLLAARTDVIRRFPYDEGQYAHWGSDIWQSYQLMDAGFVLRPVPSIVSVWREKAPPGAWKYIHDHCER
jgi:hypothetical protein